MANVLFPNFLKDTGEYARAEAFWKDRWTELLARIGEDGRWESPWLNTAFADGTPCRDGNPIFSAVCASARRGLRVLQQDPAEYPPKLSFWTDLFAQGEPDEIQELVISCVLTPQTLGEALDLMHQWIVRGAIGVPVS